MFGSYDVAVPYIIECRGLANHIVRSQVAYTLFGKS